jgi:hypothetical protein
MVVCMTHLDTMTWGTRACRSRTFRNVKQHFLDDPEHTAADMSRRKGELTAVLIDRGWPHQVALPEEACTGANYKVHADFCRDLSLCPRGKAVFHGDQWWRVFCFSDPIHADAFRERFGGEPFNPDDRGRGGAWAQWRTGARGLVPVSPEAACTDTSAEGTDLTDNSYVQNFAD